MCTIVSTDVELSSSWQVENRRNLEETLSVTLLDDAHECDLEQIVNYETCVHLLMSNSEACDLKFKYSSSTNNLKIARISIVSEAKVLELYGNCGEYLTTIHADFIDDFEDLSVYMAVLRLPQPTAECSIKLVRPKSQDQMWIYGINVALDRVQPRPETSVNFENVNRILKESGHQITEKAEKCKKFLQMYGSVIDPSKIPTRPPDPQVLMKMLESAYLPRDHPFKEQTKTVSQCLTDFLPGLGSSTARDATAESADLMQCKGKFPNTTSESSESATSIDLQLHIEQCFNTLEKKLDDKLNAIEARLNIKLDKILLQLENIQVK